MDEKLEYFKKKILAHLDDLEQKENAEKKELKKSLLAFEMTSIEKAGYPVGTIREWKGKKYIKVAPGKWKPKYDSHSRGAKMAIAALKKKIDACTDSEELMQIILENRDRFSDENGRPLPFVKELSDYISGRNDTIESEKNEKKATDEKIKNHFEEQAKKYGVDVNVENGIVSISKDGKKFSHAFRYEEGKKDGHGEDWNDGAFGNLIIYARQEGLKTPKKEEPKNTGFTLDDIRHIGDGKKGIEAIREKYQSSKSIEGDEDEIYVGKEAIQGKWKLVEADAPSASHDEVTFHKTEGFPTDINGSTINDRDYEHDTAAQETVLDIAADFDGRALGFDSPIVVTQDGVVTSGNNRTMSSKIAARKGTDTKYIEALKKRAKKFGFSTDDVAQFKHPRVVFETEHKGDYTTDEFAKYNESGKKAKSPIEKAVEVSKRMKPQIVEEIAGTISDFETMGDLYADKKASMDIFNTLIQSNIIQKTDLPQYYTDGTVTAAGKEFLETVLIGSVIDETNIRSLNTEGGKSIRQKLVRAITPLIENKGMKGYSINKELNEAVSIAVEVAHNKDKFPNVESFSKQQDMFRKLDPVSIELAKKLEGTQKGFAEFMQQMNGGLRPAANGEVDIFFGGIESKEEIVSRVLKIKDTVKKALDEFFGLFGVTV